MEMNLYKIDRIYRSKLYFLLMIPCIFVILVLVKYQFSISQITWNVARSEQFDVNEIRDINIHNANINFDKNRVVRVQMKESISESLYIITPTYRRPEQIPDLTRLSHTLMLVPNLHWLVIEDATEKSLQVAQLLVKSGLSYTHLIAPMPEEYKKSKGKPKGVSNRNKGLEWIRENVKSGVFYFADDDNTYDLELFEEIRQTKNVSMFPVGLVTKLGISTPVVRDGEFIAFYDGWIARRTYPVDMAGFAVSVKFLLERPKAQMPYKAGFEEDGFLKSLDPFNPKQMQLLAENCTKILVWHTQTKKNSPSAPWDFKKYNNTNLLKLRDYVV